MLGCCGCSSPCGVQDHVGWSPRLPDLVPYLEAGGPVYGRGLGLDDPWVPFQPKPFCVVTERKVFGLVVTQLNLFTQEKFCWLGKEKKFRTEING